MSWPLSQDYNEAIQNPHTCFADPELRQGQAVTNALGLPQPCSGNFADVYAVECPPGGTKWAVKCFTRAVRGLRERYAEISKHLRRVRLGLAVDFHYLEQGIRVAGRWYPVLKMHWVEGLTLNALVRASLETPARLDALGRVWLLVARMLRAANLAHGDLQHGNILLVPDAAAQGLAVKLIDYDGMWVPALAGTPSGEVGHPAYQHPQRLREGTYGPEVDRFPLLVIYTAIRALVVGGRVLWDRYDNGDNLLFREEDLRSPRDSELIRELQRMPDAAARALAGQLVHACEAPLAASPRIEELVSIPDVRRPAADRPPAPEPAAPARSPWDFDRAGDGGVRRPPRRGVPGWVWLAGGASAVVVAVVVVLIVLVVGNGSRPKTPDVPLVAAKGPGGGRSKDADRAKDTESDGKQDKKDKTDTPEKPAPLPRLVAFPKLSLPERGVADLQVKVERQGYAGPIGLQVVNLPPGVTCRDLAAIPAGESSVWIAFRTDGTAAEGTATVEVIATADARTADRQKLALLLPPKSAASAKPPASLPSTWKSLASMPTARSLLAAVTGPDGRIYAIGGANASGRLDTVEVYDPRTNKWAKAAPMHTAPSPGSHSGSG